jgi:hypothetical protein
MYSAARGLLFVVLLEWFTSSSVICTYVSEGIASHDTSNSFDRLPVINHWRTRMDLPGMGTKYSEVTEVLVIKLMLVI